MGNLATLGGIVAFPVWFGVGSYGALACGLICMAALALAALRLRRGTPRQLARATLATLTASALAFVPIWWGQARLDIYGPALGEGEVALMLTWAVVCGWCLPIGTLMVYLLLAPAQTPAAPAHLAGVSEQTLAALNDPARRLEPLGPGRPWGWLIALAEGDEARPLPLTRQLTLLGREIDNDIVILDDRASRHHAEIRWEHAHPHLLDRASMNGSFVNRQAVRGLVPLASGDVIELGMQRYRFALAADSAAPSTPAEETHKMPGANGSHPAHEAEPLVLTLAAMSPAGEGGRGALTRRIWPLRTALLTIGRDEGCDLRLTDPSVSRRHAQIVRQPGGYFVADLQSSNGTLLNGEPLTAPAALAAGDVLTVGVFTLRCESTSVASSETSGAARQATPHAARPASGAPTLVPTEAARDLATPGQ